MSDPSRGDEPLLLVIDVGSSSVKAGLFDAAGALEKSAATRYDTQTPGPGHVEQHATDWWDAAVASVRKVAGGVDARRIEGVTVTNQQVTTVPVDRELRPLAPAISWMDTRTSTTVDHLASSLGEEVLETVGMPLSTSWGALRVVWWQENEPRIADAAHWFLTVDAYFYSRLTGRVVTDHSNACFGPYDIRERRWSNALASALGIDLDQLPSIVEPTTAVGTVSQDAADELSLVPGTPVIAGASDQPASAVGLGVVSPSRAAVTVGTGTFVVVPTAEPNPDHRYMVSCAGVPGEWIDYGLHYVSGALVEWLVRIADFNDAADLADAAEQIGPGADGLTLLPYFQGSRTPYFDSSAKGALHGLTLGHTRAHLARAALESNAFGIRHVLETIDPSGRVERIRLGGGGAGSQFAAQLVADVCGRPTEVPPNIESTSLGAAMIGWTGLGRFETVAAATDSFVEQFREHVPAASSAYEIPYASYLDLAAEDHRGRA